MKRKIYYFIMGYQNCSVMTFFFDIKLIPSTGQSSGLLYLCCTSNKENMGISCSHFIVQARSLSSLNLNIYIYIYMYIYIYIYISIYIYIYIYIYIFFFYKNHGIKNNGNIGINFKQAKVLLLQVYRYIMENNSVSFYLK